MHISSHNNHTSLEAFCAHQHFGGRDGWALSPSLCTLNPFLRSFSLWRVYSLPLYMEGRQPVSPFISIVLNSLVSELPNLWDTNHRLPLGHQLLPRMCCVLQVSLPFFLMSNNNNNNNNNKRTNKLNFRRTFSMKRTLTCKGGDDECMTRGLWLNWSLEIS